MIDERPVPGGDIHALLEDLSPEQRRVVEYAGRPLLVLAGPGSGKTRTITYRMAAAALSGRCAPSRILAVTFTRAAAREMQSRVSTLTQGLQPHIGTFHWLCAALLRRYPLAAGLQPGFEVLAPARARKVMQEAVGGTLQPGADAAVLTAAVSRIKNGASSDSLRTTSLDPEQIRTARRLYDRAMRGLNAVDLDDLQVLAMEMLQRSDRVQTWCARQHDEVVVDEYQDINPVQREILSLLLPESRALMGVGDDDQSIYTWREAIPESVPSFMSQFPDGQIMTLEQNYRSTGSIVRAANALIDCNEHRFGKTMKSDRDAGTRPLLVAADDPRAEAEWASRMLRSVHDGGVPWNECAVLIRVNAQARLLEEALVEEGVPYQLRLKARFYDRPEVRHALAYLTLALQPADSEAFSVILASAPGFGPKLLERVQIEAATRDLALREAIVNGELTGMLPANVRRFMVSADSQMNDVTDHREFSIPDVVEVSVRATRADLGLTTPADHDDDYLAELLELAREEHDRRGTLRSLLARLRATSTTSQAGDGVQIVSLHGSKGLEFSIVLILGLEEGLLPHRRSLENPAMLEEERRLCFVGITRARDSLVLSYARQRAVGGERGRVAPSRFLREIGSANLRSEPANHLGGRQPAGTTPQDARNGTPRETDAAN